MTLRTLAAVRVFNRFYTRVIGALSDQHLGIGLTLGQGRVLFEIGQLEPVEARALKAHLGLDAGYLSRCLAELEAARLVARSVAPGDGRVKRITLTAKGRRKLGTVDDESNRAVAGMLEALDAEGESRLEAAMLEIRRLLDDRIEIAAEPPDSPEARACLNAYFSELSRRFPQGFDPAASAGADPVELRPPGGAFLLVRCGGRPRGCGAVKRLGAGVGEIKRMWIHPELRGRGAGRQLLGALEASARALDFHTVRLDTSAHLTEAVKLYHATGYVEIAPYNDNTYAAHWFEKRLVRR